MIRLTLTDALTSIAWVLLLLLLFYFFFFASLPELAPFLFFPLLEVLAFIKCVGGSWKNVENYVSYFQSS
jgi:hypothetical protein